MRFSHVGALLLVAIGGCTSLPEFDKRGGVTPGVIVDVIHCELIAARSRNPRLQYKAGQKGSEYWVAVADLTLQVDEQATLTPSFTNGLGPVFDWGLKLDSQTQRVYTQSIQYIIPSLKADKCKDLEPTGASLTGKLGLSEIVDMAFESIDRSNPYDEGVTLFESKQRSSSFGGLIQFVIVKNVNGVGPTWTLSHFKGPGKLFAGQRTDTHKLSISFAPGTPGKTDSALAVAKESNRSLLLNQIAPKAQ